MRHNKLLRKEFHYLQMYFCRPHFNNHLLMVFFITPLATSLMYIGLNLTFASSFQMFRGAVIIFVALLSVAFLQRRLGYREWTGISIIVVGLAMVGAADMLSGSNDASKYSRNNIITGDLLILTAQIITAIQMVYEEKFVAGMDIPALQGTVAFYKLK